MKYINRDVKVHQFSNDWVIIDQLPLEDEEPGFQGKVISPLFLTDVTQSDVDDMKKRHPQAGFFWHYFHYDANQEKFVRKVDRVVMSHEAEPR